MAEEKKRNGEFWALALECAHLGVWDWDVLSGDCFYSPTWSHMLGYEDGELANISDLWLQTDERNLDRYARDEQKYGVYGVFDLPEGVTVRHHDPKWIETLTSDFTMVALDELEVVTMNGNPAKAFQWFGITDE